MFVSGAFASFTNENTYFDTKALLLNIPNLDDYSLPYFKPSAGTYSSLTTGDAQSANALNGTYYLMAFYNEEDDWSDTLQNAINSVPSGSIIDCTFWDPSGPNTTTITSPIIVNKPVKILLGSYDINVSFVGAASPTNHAFNIASNGVTIEGFSRSAKSGSLPTGQTRIIMTEAGDGYHIFGTGSNNVTIQNLDLLGVQSCCAYDLTTGVGGVCFIEPNPGVSGAGNTTNGITISNLFISGTRDHGIYFVGSIMSTVKDCRVSAVGGHGFFTTYGSTSTYFYNCYASSGNLAGFCIGGGTSYSTLENCAAEGFGLGYWIRSANNINLIGCGAEANNAPNDGAPAGDLGITFPNSSGTYTVDDWSSDMDDYLTGTNYIITGGDNIVLNAPYSRNPNGNTGGNKVYHYGIGLTANNVTLINPTCNDNTGFQLLNYDIAIFSNNVNNTVLFFDPATGGTVSPTDEGVYIAETNSPGSNDTVILDLGTNTQIIGGGKIFRNTQFYRASIDQGDGTNTISSTATFANTLGYNLSASRAYSTVVGAHNRPGNISSRFVVGVGYDNLGKKDGFRVDVDTNMSASIMVPINTGNPAVTYYTTGSMWFNPTTNQLRIFNGTTWRTINTI
jgi:hypothetical protein